MDITWLAPFEFSTTFAGITINFAAIFMQLVATIAVLALVKLAISAIPPSLRAFDDWIDLFKKIDLSQRMHTALAKALSYLVELIAIAYLFFIWGSENPLTNTAFEIIALFLLTKAAIVMVYPSIKGFDERLKSNRISRHARKMTEKLVTYTIWSLFIIGSIYLLGFTDILTAAIAGAGVMGIVIGFAAKDTVSNVFGGMAVVLDKPFVIGDTIEVVGHAGTVEEIALRSTTIKLFDNKVVILPNSILSSQPIINYTREKVRRIEIPVGISYDSDIKKATGVIKSALGKIDGVVLDKRMVEVIVDNFGDYSINLSVRAWVETDKGVLAMKTRCAEEIKAAFDRNGIEIPYPVRVNLQKGKSRQKGRK